jgi:transcriptional regulator with XRE-family HTH domain
MSVLGSRLRELRKKAGFTQGQLVEYSGVSQSSLSDIERGKIAPKTLDAIATLAKYYKTTTDYLLGLTDHAEPYPAASNSPASKDKEPGTPVQSDIDQIAEIMHRIDIRARAETTNDIMLMAMRFIENVRGELAAEEFYSAVDSLRRTGDDSALTTWFAKYLGGDNSGDGDQ